MTTKKQNGARYTNYKSDKTTKKQNGGIYIIIQKCD